MLCLLPTPHQALRGPQTHLTISWVFLLTSTIRETDNLFHKEALLCLYGKAVLDPGSRLPGSPNSSGTYSEIHPFNQLTFHEHLKCQEMSLLLGLTFPNDSLPFVQGPVERLNSALQRDMKRTPQRPVGIWEFPRLLCNSAISWKVHKVARQRSCTLMSAALVAQDFGKSPLTSVNAFPHLQNADYNISFIY